MCMEYRNGTAGVYSGDIPCRLDWWWATHEINTSVQAVVHLPPPMTCLRGLVFSCLDLGILGE